MKNALIIAAVLALFSVSEANAQAMRCTDLYTEAGVPFASVCANSAGNGWVVNSSGFKYSLTCGTGYVHAVVTRGQMVAYRVRVSNQKARLTRLASVRELTRAVAEKPSLRRC